MLNKRIASQVFGGGGCECVGGSFHRHWLKKSCHMALVLTVHAKDGFKKAY